MSTLTHAAHPPTAGAAIAATVVGFLALSLLGRAVTLFLGILVWGTREDWFNLPGPMLIGALGLGAAACGWGASLMVRRKLEWVSGAPLAILGGVLGMIAVVGSVVVFIGFVPREARTPHGAAQSTTSTSTGPIVR